MSLEEVKKKLETLHSDIENSIPDLARELGDKLHLISENVAVEKLKDYIHNYVNEVIALIDSNQYTEELDDQAFSKIFSEFKKENEVTFATLDPDKQRQIEINFDLSLMFLRANLKKMQDFKQM